jgi:selenoprotein W-related protein
MPYPKVSIKFCTKCKWNLRATWYLQELLQTFGEKLGEVSLIPYESGVFRVEVQKDEASPVIQIWDRKEENGFPDSKILKQKVRNIAFPDEVLGHVDKPNKNEGKLITETKLEQDTCADKDECTECKEAENDQI